MNKKLRLMKSIKVGALAASLTLGALAVQAMPGGPGGMHGGGHHAGGMGPGADAMLELVDASDAQRSQIRALMQAARNELRAQYEAMRKLHAEQRALLAAPTIDAAAVEAKRQQLQLQREAISKRMSLAMVEAARVLTPEQRAKLADRMARREARMAEHMKEQRGGKPGQ